MEYSLFEYLWFFMIYAFLGWCLEVSYHVVKSKKFINRGFLNGPVCPIYGVGMVILIFFLTPLSNNFLLLFIGSVLLTSMLEFITGFVLEKIFHDKWWNYSQEPFNIKGYICLTFSIAWGLGAILILNIVHPMITVLVSFLQNKIGLLLLILVSGCFIADFIITVSGILEIKKKLKILEEIAENLQSYSEDVGEYIYKGMTLAIKTKENIKTKLDEQKLEIEDNFNDSKQKIEELKMKYESIKKEKSFVHKRLEEAFPNIKKKLDKIDHHKND
ncbi:putative ABC transporter permease [Paratissierella segnis]|nr:hypothetical protein [Paratissierella segnis]